MSDHILKRSYNAGPDFICPIMKSIMKNTGLSGKHRVQIQHMGVWHDTMSKFTLDHNAANDQNLPLLGYIAVPRGSHRLQ